MPRMVLRSILPERVLGSPATTSTLRSAATGPIWSRISSTSSAHAWIGVDARFEHDEPARDLAFELVVDTDDRALGNGGVAGEDFFHFPGGQPVARNVDDVVGTAHDIEVSVFVPVSPISCEVGAGVA